ncbi:uncharacterized protein LOC141639684 [Silene latifolia]|uniref:uncharacterized protein LOC141639684 n=1 Tax=Silene latifolia TaxID=37657 RepID=UPI003D77472F
MGALYTWNNKQCPADRVYSRLDCFLVNQEWLNDYPLLYAHFLPEGIFDHTPCVVQSTLIDEKRARPFKYFNMWSLAPNFKETVQVGWTCMQTGTKMYELAKKLKNLKQGLKQLNRSRFADIENNAEVALTKLNKIQQSLGVNPQDLSLIQQECEARENYQQLAEAQNQFLQQKAKMKWSADGDANTSFFHGILKTRRRQNQTVQITDHQGNQHTDKEGVQESFLRFYTQLLGHSHPITPVSTRVVQQGNKCDESHHQILLMPVTDAEIKSTIFSIPDDKAPGPDGYSSQFFKTSWDTVGGDVCAAVHEFFRNGKMLKQLNATNVTLIPKVPNPLTGKSNVYFNGVSGEVRREIVQVSGCIEGKLPFKYLGVPIKPSKLSIKDCQPLIDKVLQRIRQLGTKNLSYAGRLVLIKAVYRTLHSYWASIFIIPKAKVLLKIEAKMQNFLWHGGTEYARTPTCCPVHPSKLWMQWVHSVYLKGQEWEDYNPPQDASWTWKKVCKLKRSFKQRYHRNEWAMVPELVATQEVHETEEWGPE